MGDRTALENLWRQRLNEAKLRLDFASNYVKEIQRDFSSGELPAPDGHDAYQQALHAESHAIAEYRRILRIFSELVVSGKKPDEAASRLLKSDTS